MKYALIRALLAAVLSLWLTTSAMAGFDEGLAAYERYDFATALEEWLPLAKGGNANAQYYLGSMFEWGDGVPKDNAETVKWYRLAAEQGHAEAQYSLGYILSTGAKGVQRDWAETFKWNRLAAEQGHTSAQKDLGIMYTGWQGVPKDYVPAHMWLSLAAAKGDETARNVRDSIAEQMTAADISKAQSLAREWLEEHGE